MKKLLLLLLVLPEFLLAQEIRKKVKENTLEHNVEHYYVLKSDTTLKHGPYRKVNFFGGQPIASGFYYKGMKDSTWFEFSLWSYNLQAKGNYLKDKKIGVWNYYDAQSVLEQQYDHSKNKLVYYKPDSVNRIGIIRKRDTLYVKAKQPPLFLGGAFAAQTIVAQHLQFPDEAAKDTLFGVIEISITIDTNGHAGPYWIKKGLSKALDSASIRAVRQLPQTWIPAINGSKKAKSIYVHKVPFTFG